MIFAAVHVAALVRLLWVRYPYRWFVAALALWTVQAVNVSLFPGTTREWTATWWLYPEAALLLVTAAATVEAIERERANTNGFAGLQLRVASIGIPACLVGFSCRFIAPPHGDTLATFTGLRSWVWSYLALSLLVVVLLVTLKGTVRVMLHSWLLLVVLLAHALLSSFVAAEHSHWWRDGYRALLVLCLIIWSGPGAKPRFPKASHGTPA